MKENTSKIKNGLYRHHKGKYYSVIGTGHHSETLEELVFYVALYDLGEFGVNSLWARPVANFTETLEIDGKKVQRFEYIDEINEETFRV